MKPDKVTHATYSKRLRKKVAEKLADVLGVKIVYSNGEYKISDERAGEK